MGPLQCVTPVQVESLVFPPAVKPLGSSKTFFLGGAGARGLEIQGKFVKFTAIGVYLEEKAVPLLSLKWKGKTGRELTDAVDFFRDVVTGPFEKFMQVTMILPLTGQQYSEKVTENCVAYWKAVGLYTEAEAIAVEKFKQVFNDETFPPGSTIFFTLNPSGSLTIGFSKDSSIPEKAGGVIENKQMSEAVLESMIGKHGVSPEAKQSLATRVSQLLKEFDVETEKVKVEGEEGEKLKQEMSPLQCVTQVQVESLVFPPAVRPLGSSKTFFLGGAGARGLEIQGKFIKFTAIGVYLEEKAVPFLSLKWKGITGQELTDAVDFFRDVVTGPFEKFMQVTMILPLTGQQYSEKVTENCVAYWKAVGLYTEAEAIAVEKFKQVFKEETFPPGSTIFFTLNPSGSLTIGFSKDSSIPEQAAGVIENKQLSEAVLESMIGKHGVSPEAKQSLATRVSQLLKEFDVETEKVKVEGEEGEKLKQ